MNSEKPAFTEFSPSDILDIERLAGLGYTIHKIAMYFDVCAAALLSQYSNPDSKFRYHYDRGVLLSQAKADLSAADAAEKGNISAIERMDKVRKAQRLRNIKEEIFGRSF